jgi:hypothetical protein
MTPEFPSTSNNQPEEPKIDTDGMPDNARNEEYLTAVIDGCFRAVDKSKFGPMLLPDGRYHPVALQVYMTMLSSIAPRYSYSEILNLMPKEPWQDGD